MFFEVDSCVTKILRKSTEVLRNKINVYKYFAKRE